MNNENKTAIISGSSTGLGAHIAESLVNDDYNVIITYYENRSKAENFAKKLAKIGDVKLF